MLVSLFNLFCFRKRDNPAVRMKKNGTMVTVTQDCLHCGDCAFTWRSQPQIFGRYPAGNILLSFGVLTAGASISRVLLVLRNMGLSAITARSFYQHQKEFLFPVILYQWETHRRNMMLQLQSMKNVVWCGDARFDSMGHYAKFGTYTMFCSTIQKVTQFCVVQVKQI